MFSFDYKYRVRYADVDQMGYMYYGHYARLYEIGRVEALRSLGVRYKDFEDQGFIMPVYENNSKFLSPAKYDEMITIRVILNKIPKARIVFNYEIYNEQEERIHLGETTLVFVNTATDRIMACPENIEIALAPFFKTS
ncbi:acyl-CoA thioesterase [Arcticibacterium luteifluviistationis]|uniref:Thioesterase n=1 Tax=Arcticibacterium luteifluviistationis TaxID=1784714 RepID=A0A2Z4G8Z5_9BACT|nr:thioesterase family protein [Arcticibacterium luteifluviistationis]AWV97560.1 thioesterase [Arcticibacterium luteifluviistationis]